MSQMSHPPASYSAALEVRPAPKPETLLKSDVKAFLEKLAAKAEADWYQSEDAAFAGNSVKDAAAELGITLDWKEYE